MSKLKKPGKTHKVECYDWSTCRQYIEKKYGYDVRDYFGTHNNFNKNCIEATRQLGFDPEDYTGILDQNHPEYKERLARRIQVYDLVKKNHPYKDYWHWIIEGNSHITNGSYFWLTHEMLEGLEEEAFPDQEWAVKITRDFLNEFGANKEDVQFYVWW